MFTLLQCHARRHSSQLFCLHLLLSSPPEEPSHEADNEEVALIMATSSPIQERPLLHSVQSGFRRSFTAPPRSLSYHERAGLDPSDSAADILYSHSSARIVKFSPPSSAIRSVSSPTSQDYDYPVDTIETLPWASTTETTVASGLLIIEKVQGSTSFLKSGAVMHAILRNSQCWCVDGESKFVLRIRKFEYYRIELPSSNDSDRAKVEELKAVLGKILRFERTPCPFKRGFHVDLSESDITPRRKGAWKRRQSSQVSTSVGGTPSPLSRHRSSRTDALHGGVRTGKDGQEGTPFIDGSDSDEDEIRSESDGQEEPITHSPAISLSEPPVDRQDETQGDRNGKVHSEKEEPEMDEVDIGQANTEPPASVAKPPEMAKEDLISTSSGPSKRETEPVPELETPEPQVDETETEPELEAAESRVDENEKESVPELESPKARMDETEADHSTVTTFTEPELQGKAATQAEPSPLEPTAGEISPPDAITLEPALAENADADKESQSLELDENEANDLDGTIEAQSDSRPIDTLSIASSTNSFHSLDAPDSPNSPTSLSSRDSQPSPTPRAELLDPLVMQNHHAHKRELSERTITPSSPWLNPVSDFANTSPERPSTSASDRPATPQLARSSVSDGSWTEVETPSGPHQTNQIRHRLKGRRSLSPLPPSPTLFTPTPHQDRSNHLTSAILQKACSLALGKPMEVVVMLIHILARIAGGATVNDLMSGDLFKKPGQEREQQQNRNLPDQIDTNSDNDLDEDDFGVPLRGRIRSNEVVKAAEDTDSLSDLD